MYTLILSFIYQIVLSTRNVLDPVQESGSGRKQDVAHGIN